MIIPKSQIENTCPKHSNNILNLICETCDQIICCDCTLVDHPITSHKFDFIIASIERWSTTIIYHL